MCITPSQNRLAILAPLTLIGLSWFQTFSAILPFPPPLSSRSQRANSDSHPFIPGSLFLETVASAVPLPLSQGTVSVRFASDHFPKPKQYCPEDDRLCAPVKRRAFPSPGFRKSNCTLFRQRGTQEKNSVSLAGHPYMLAGQSSWVRHECKVLLGAPLCSLEFPRLFFPISHHPVRRASLHARIAVRTPVKDLGTGCEPLPQTLCGLLIHSPALTSQAPPQDRSRASDSLLRVSISKSQPHHCFNIPPDRMSARASVQLRTCLFVPGSTYHLPNLATSTFALHTSLCCSE